MLVDTAYNVTVGNAIKAALDSGAVAQVWGGAEPASSTATPTGTKLVESPITASQVSVNAAGEVLLTGITDNAADATGSPSFVRIVDASMNIQLTAKMASNTAAGTKEVVVTDQDDASATQILQNRKVVLTLKI